MFTSYISPLCCLMCSSSIQITLNGSNRGTEPLPRSPNQAASHLDKSGVFFASVFYDTLRYAKKVSEPPPRYIMTGGARLAISDTHKHHTYRKM